MSIEGERGAIMAKFGSTVSNYKVQSSVVVYENDFLSSIPPKSIIAIIILMISP